MNRAGAASSGGTPYSCSPRNRRGSRLVASTSRCSEASSSRVTRGAAPQDVLEVVDDEEEVLLTEAARHADTSTARVRFRSRKRRIPFHLARPSARRGVARVRECAGMFPGDRALG